MVEGEHLLAAEPLAQWMPLHQPFELARDLRVPADREVRVEAIAQAGEPQLLQPRDLGLGEARLAGVRERRAAPQRERLAQRRGRLQGVALRELGPAATNSSSNRSASRLPGASRSE